MDIIRKIAQELNIKAGQVSAVVGLIDEGNTIPFIARYRKEAHGALDDEVLRSLDERLRYLRGLEEKKASVLKTLKELGVLTPELAAAMEEAETLAAVEDIYRPYRPKRRTRAVIAKEKGLGPLADMILAQKLKEPVEKAAEAFVSEEKEVGSADEAIAGAKDIIAEKLSDDPDYRSWIREQTRKTGELSCSGKEEVKETVFANYAEFSSPVSRLNGYQVLAINRGEAQKQLTVKLTVDADRMKDYLKRKAARKDNPFTNPVIHEAADDAYDRLIAPSVEREIRNELTEAAEEGSIKVFGRNVRQLLMQPPIAGQTVLGWDPAFRTGCKLAVVDPQGKVLDTTVIYPTAPHNKVDESIRVVKHLIGKDHITLISVGNGTASRESEQVIVKMIHENHLSVKYVITDEAGASVYSASKLATEEFPSFDVGQRSAISIARRVQDPLAELVKIDPRSVGVGQYQHDMDQKKLSESLETVVEDCVNSVGVDLNTASAALLQYVSGISKTVAANIVAYREENGAFTDRRQLLKVPKLGPKAYEQCAGFLRIRGGANPLDATAVHPESYEAAEAILKADGRTPGDVAGGGLAGIAKRFTSGDGAKQLNRIASELGVGELTLLDILKELEKPGRDPRADMPAPILRSDVLSMEDLKEGMELKGTVRNIVDFGAFVDIGVHQDGLVHLSQIADRYIKHPSEVLQVGDVVDVRVISVDRQKKRISLSMRQVGK